MRIKVLVKYPGPPSIEDPTARLYKEAPIDTLVDAVLDTDKNVLLLPFNVELLEPTEGKDYYNYQRKDGLSGNRLKTLDTLLEDLKSDKSLRGKCIIIQGIISTKDTDEIINLVITRLSNQNVSSQEKLELLTVLEIILLIKLYN